MTLDTLGPSGALRAVGALTAPARRLVGALDAPAHTIGAGASGAARVVRAWSDNAVDDWGRDDEFTARAFMLSKLRWNVTVGGTEHIDHRRGGLVVVNARRWALAPLFTALALGEAVGRPVRFVGRPDVAPVGPVLQRLGGLLANTGEIRSALAAGDLVVMGTAAGADHTRLGAVDHSLIGAAVAARTPVHPAAALSAPLRRGARLEVGAVVRPVRIRRGPLAELELADQIGVRIDAMLAELGGTELALDSPLDWPLGMLARWAGAGR